MQIVFSDRQLVHRPRQYGVHGRLVAPVENASRAETLLARLASLGLSHREPDDVGLAAITAVHTEDYVRFLAGAWPRFQALKNAGPEVLPNVHPYLSQPSGHSGGGARRKLRATGILAEAGWYIGDLSCAMGERTHEAVHASAMSAASAADLVLAGAPSAFALCRPPGHHAYADRASGFCFLNNAAIAAQRLRQAYAKVAMIDFDTHHGDGTQTIFYERGDVFVGSVHTDPGEYYPFYLGYGDERGIGEGEGCNLNIPLPFGANDAAYVAGVEKLVEAAVTFGAQALVVSAGWDAHRDDPLSRLDVGDAAYPAIGALIGRMNLPTVIVQEGGYSLPAVATSAPAFVEAFLEASR
ncbi:histone deacetylase family protein [Fulvimarina sp. 2208YS6-2-32]|uniref:Histone deacetylase family protein n=1 Tax=Fulvimarina uroteuthidis TaxID=3098149 RepID=A0ABU5HZW2_9HYPH|nr:histone deacetylase family protein [Fulvimarina sp. 2208YS6-2-32]MDY8108674.1 histone deacetylase family protein [Fulvimarina sp. 2208YS6-2-32]